MRLSRKVICLLIVSCCSGAAQAAWPVTVIANIPGKADQMANMAKYVEQVSLLEKNFMQAQETFKSMNGLRKVGDMMNNQLLAQFLPADYLSAYAALKNGQSGSLAGISGTLNQIARESQFSQCNINNRSAGSIANCNAEWQTMAMNKYVGQAGYDQTATNIANLRQFVNGITSATDPKTIADLSARIAVEQVKMQNEQMKLQTVQMMMKADEDIAHARNAQATSTALMAPTALRWGVNAGR